MESEEVDEEERNYSPGKGFFIAVGAVMIILGMLVVAALAVPIQPGLPKQTVASGIIMPSGAADDQLNFSPANVTVVIGINNTVTWTNTDTVGHTVVSSTVPVGAQSFSSDIINPGGTFTVTLTVPGTYDYFCSIHPAWMRASIVVVGAGGASVSSSNSTAAG
jgi:plastocyanin